MRWNRNEFSLFPLRTRIWITRFSLFCPPSSSSSSRYVFLGLASVDYQNRFTPLFLSPPLTGWILLGDSLLLSFTEAMSLPDWSLVNESFFFFFVFRLLFARFAWLALGGNNLLSHITLGGFLYGAAYSPRGNTTEPLMYFLFLVHLRFFSFNLRFSLTPLPKQLFLCCARGLFLLLRNSPS